MLREPIDLPPIVSMELIQISNTTSIPYAPKARKIIEETKKKEEERLVSEQAPPAAGKCFNASLFLKNLFIEFSLFIPITEL